MPLFEYKCDECGQTFEKLVTRETPVACPHCGGGIVTKLLNTFAVSTSSGDTVPDCSSAGCGFERGGCGSGMCAHHHG